MTKAIAAMLFAWAGLLLGVSFVATPAKFLAPSLPLAQALDVGRWTFQVLAWIEWPLAAVMSAAVLLGRTRMEPLWKPVAACLAAVAIILACETFWLRPYLDARVLAIMGGESVPPGSWHIAYIAIDAVKLALILAAGVLASRCHETARS